MPGLIAVSEFVDETREDYNSPTTSTFVSRMPQCRQTITSLEEVSTRMTRRHRRIPRRAMISALGPLPRAEIRRSDFKFDFPFSTLVSQIRSLSDE